MQASLEKKYKQLFIDVSQYEQPKPFEKVIQLLLTIKKGQYICMHHRKEPLPLLQFLQEHGFAFLSSEQQSHQWEVIIWNKKDKGLEKHCLTQFSA